MIFVTIVTIFLLLLILIVAANREFSPILKILLVGIFIGGLFFAHNPERLDDFALFLGVDAGSDLVFYITSMLIIYAVLVIYHKIVAVNKRVEIVCRHIAISRVIKPK